MNIHFLLSSSSSSSSSFSSSASSSSSSSLSYVFLFVSLFFFLFSSSSPSSSSSSSSLFLVFVHYVIILLLFFLCFLPFPFSSPQAPPLSVYAFLSIDWLSLPVCFSICLSRKPVIVDTGVADLLWASLLTHSGGTGWQYTTSCTGMHATWVCLVRSWYEERSKINSVKWFTICRFVVVFFIEPQITRKDCACFLDSFAGSQTKLGKVWSGLFWMTTCFRSWVCGRRGSQTCAKIWIQTAPNIVPAFHSWFLRHQFTLIACFWEPGRASEMATKIGCRKQG